MPFMSVSKSVCSTTTLFTSSVELHKSLFANRIDVDACLSVGTISLQVQKADHDSRRTSLHGRDRGIVTSS